MINSRPLDIDGRFVGVAVFSPQAQASLWRFLAVDPLVDDLDGATFASPAEAQRVAGLVLARNRGRGLIRLPD